MQIYSMEINKQLLKENLILAAKLTTLRSFMLESIQSPIAKQQLAETIEKLEKGAEATAQTIIQQIGEIEKQKNFQQIIDEINKHFNSNK